MTTVSVKEEDYLDQDPPLRGQNFVCMSFLSPEEILKKKEVYFFEQFLSEFSKDMNEFFDKLSNKYSDEVDVLKMIKDRYSYVFNSDNIQDEYLNFVNSRSSELESLFHEKVDFQTSIRGIKIRGVFDTMKEAEIRSQVLKRMDDKFNVYVAQVGCWCPWSPNPDDITDQEYAETQLNTLMKNYKENQTKKDIFFEERKRDLQFLKTKEKLEEKDNWIKNKENEVIETPSCPVNSPKTEHVVDPVVEPVTEPAVEPVVEPVVEHVVEPVTEPVVEPAVEPVGEHVVEPAVETVVEPVVETVVEPVVEPVDEEVMAHVYAKEKGISLEAAFAELSTTRHY